MEHDHAHDDTTERFSQATWDARYGTGERIWSGNPNPRLVEHASGMPAGDALDVGAGEGADVVWLAEQGWRVTALDVSPVALELTRLHADQSGVGEASPRRRPGATVRPPPATASPTPPR